MTAKTEEDFWRGFEYRLKVRAFRRQHIQFPYRLRDKRTSLPAQGETVLQGDATQNPLGPNGDQPVENNLVVLSRHGLESNLEDLEHIETTFRREDIGGKATEAGCCANYNDHRRWFR